MPITQDRLAQVLEAGEFIESIYFWFAGEVSTALSKLRTGAISQAECIETLSRLADRPDTAIIRQSTVLQVERTHWRLTHNKNSRDRERKRRASPSASPGPMQMPPQVRMAQDHPAPPPRTIPDDDGTPYDNDMAEAISSGLLGQDEPGLDPATRAQIEHEAELARRQADYLAQHGAAPGNPPDKDEPNQ